MRLTKKRGVIALIGAVAVAAVVAIPTVLASSKAGGPVTTATKGVSPAVTSAGSCNNTLKTAWASDDFAFQSTVSTSFIPVTGMSVNFTSTGHCAKVRFSNEAAAEGDDLMYVRVLVDGTQCLPGPVQWIQKDNVSPTNYLHATSYEFVCQFAAAHHHTAAVEFRSYLGAGGAYSVRPTMVVDYS